MKCCAFFFFFWLLTVALFGQVYQRNKNKNLIKIDSDVKENKFLMTSLSDPIHFPHLYTKVKTQKTIEIWSAPDTLQKKTIETGFVRNVYITDGLRNIFTSIIRFAGGNGEFLSDDFYINYIKPFPDRSKKLNIRILEPVVKIAPGRVVGVKYGREIRSGGINQLYDPVMGSKSKIARDIEARLKEKKSSYLRPRLFDLKLQKVEAAKSYLSLEAHIEDLYFNTFQQEYESEKDNPEKTGLRRYFSTGSLLIDWNFKTPDGSLVFHIPVRVVSSTKLSESNSVFEHLLKENISSLMSHDSLFAWIEMHNQKLSSKLSHESIVLIKKDDHYANAKSIIKSSTPCVVTVHNVADKSHGSGFLISSDGYLITNYHVIKNGKGLKVQFNHDTARYEASVIKIEEDIDLALLKVNRTGLPFIELAKSDNVETGDVVYAIGTPSDTKLGQSVAKGIISGRRELDDKLYLQSDVSINPGNSGGPLVNEEGKVIGVVVMKIVGMGYEGLSFAIPSSVAIEKLELHYK